MYSGFWHVKIAPEDKMKAAFSTPSGHYHFRECFMGGVIPSPVLRD
jgi:hypothetical protein